MFQRYKMAANKVYEPEHKENNAFEYINRKNMYRFISNSSNDKDHFEIL